MQVAIRPFDGSFSLGRKNTLLAGQIPAALACSTQSLLLSWRALRACMGESGPFRSLPDLVALQYAAASVGGSRCPNV